MSIVVYIEELTRSNTVDAACYIERDGDTWYAHAERFENHTLLFTNKEKLLNFLGLFFEMDATFRTTVYVVDRDEVDIDDLVDYPELFGYNDVVMDEKLLRRYINICDAEVLTENE